MKNETVRNQVLKEVQEYIDNNDIYQVEFGHYEPPLGYKWTPIQTKRVNIKEALK